jgi:alpha-galactosidase
MPRRNLEIDELSIRFSVDGAPSDRIFVNGYQTWTNSREFAPSERLYGLRWFGKAITSHYKMAPYGDYELCDYPAKAGEFHGATLFYIRRSADTIELIGSLSEEFGFTYFEYSRSEKMLCVRKDCAGLSVDQPFVALDLLSSSGAEADVMDAYFELASPKPREVPLASGWTSWYNYYTHISEAIVRDNLEALAKLKAPLEFFQIDDGYQAAVGDWLQINDKFPSGMAYLAEEIRAKGYKPGLWLAPFICERSSAIFREKPDWIQKDSRGEFVVAGRNTGWSGLFYALDIDHPEVREYLTQVFRCVFDEWKFEMVKLDFLYAAAIEPGNGKSRGQRMAEGMEFLRELAGDRMILGCGVPLGSAFGLVDYCRIGSDVALKWEDAILKAIGYRERVSTINALESAISRRCFQGRAFYNDPDVYILRSTKEIKMDERQRYTLFFANLLFGGLVFTSDHVGEYKQNEKRWFLSQFPLRKKDLLSVREDNSLYSVAFETAGRTYYSLLNLSDRLRRAELPDGTYVDWGGRPGSVSIRLEPFQSLCFYRVKGGEHEILTSSGHMFPGSEVESMEVSEGALTLSVHKDVVQDSRIVIRVPDNRTTIEVNGAEIAAERWQGFNVVHYSHRFSS